MALWRLRNGRKLRTFDPTLKKEGETYPDTIDRMVPEDSYFEEYSKFLIRVQAIINTEITSVSEEQAKLYKEKFINAEIARFDKIIDSLTNLI